VGFFGVWLLVTSGVGFCGVWLLVASGVLTAAAVRFQLLLLERCCKDCVLHTGLMWVGLLMRRVQQQRLVCRLLCEELGI
jgi:hypothetical protein